MGQVRQANLPTSNISEESMEVGRLWRQNEGGSGKAGGPPTEAQDGRQPKKARTLAAVPSKDKTFSTKLDGTPVKRRHGAKPMLDENVGFPISDKAAKLLVERGLVAEHDPQPGGARFPMPLTAPALPLSSNPGPDQTDSQQPPSQHGGPSPSPTPQQFGNPGILGRPASAVAHPTPMSRSLPTANQVVRHLPPK